jgi:hypothetical protein
LLLLAAAVAVLPDDLDIDDPRDDIVECTGYTHGRPGGRLDEQTSRPRRKRSAF